MRLKDEYDWVVIGDAPGALLSAGLVAKLGLSTLVLPFRPSSALKISASGQYLDMEPNLILGGGSPQGTSSLLFDCLEHLGVLQSEKDLFTKDCVLPQVVTPFDRVQYSLDYQVLKRELDRDFTPDRVRKTGFIEALERVHEPLTAFWRGLPERLTVVRGAPRKNTEPQSATELLRRLLHSSSADDAIARSWFSKSRCWLSLLKTAADERFADIVRGIWFGLAGNDAPSENSAFDILQLLSIGQGASGFQGGMSAYRDFLLQLTRKHGAHVPENLECKRLFVQDGQLMGVQVSSLGNVIRVGGGIAGCPLRQVEKVLSLSGRSWSRGLKTPSKPLGWRFTIGLTVSSDAIPPGMGKRLIWKEPDAPVLDVEVTNPSNYGLSEDMHRFVFVRTMMPFSEESLRPEYQRSIASRMFKQVEDLFPFMGLHVIDVYPDFRNGADNDFGETYGFTSVDDIPGNLLVYSGNGIGSRTGVEGLFVSSAESFPNLGNFGGVVAAFESAAWIAHRCGVPGPLA